MAIKKNFTFWLPIEKDDLYSYINIETVVESGK